ncbi:hypothetical protein LP52_00170 [Streptomonospora alba]|uniref:AAA+ ATPase domain-containing protein n=1 Tax=Streptomonospora alba TaxID=183763 RepID=A0A0C2JUC6_9ACTN|nr:ATP-binding protein [Streptomonospora alba]KII00573.1 hypothetical protein LP52_00170 [Streptomonospora alba]
MLTGSTGRILGRQEAVEALEECITRSGSAEQPAFLLFTGTGGSGKTALLNKLAAEIDQVVPYAHFDFGRVEKNAGLPEVLSALAFELGRRCPGYGRLRFHRLVVGLLAMSEDVDVSDPDKARRTMIDVLRRNRGYDKVWEFTRASAGDLAGLLGVPAPLRPTFGALASLGVDYVTSREAGSSFLLGEPYRWYGHQDREHTADPMRVLGALNRRAGNLDDRENREAVEGLLTEAFLADLRAAFSHGIRSKPGMYDCVVLLDNIDSELGERFRRHYLRAIGHKPRAVPLVAAATARQASERHANEHIRVVPLRELTPGETEELARPELPGGVDHRVAPLVHGLTGGHPGSTALMLEAAATWPSAVREGAGALLAQEDPRSAAEGKPGVLVEQRLREDLLRSVPDLPEAVPVDDALLATLAALAVARSADDAAWIISERLEGALLGAEALWRSCLWHEGATTGDRALLRWLLLRWSYRHGDDTVPRLRRELRDRCRTSGDTVGELYHALGVGDVAACVRGLAESLPHTGDARPWLDQLHAVTTVPRAADAHAPPSPHELQIELAGQVADAEPGHLPTVARVTVGMWIAGDPGTAVDRYYLHTWIANDLRELATRSARPVGLFEEADRHDALAQDWKS